ncbi:hypothetical protein MP228_010363 [Amoeboaphelidium protococcarum]|nr:hypothetical protein MP228_010363 [Amoeboaphelidium protococcarum]
MMQIDNQFKRLETGQYHKSVDKQLSPESRYYSKFKSVVHAKEFAAITSIECSPIAPYDAVVAASTRLQIYDGKNNQVKKSIARFKDVVHCASWRSDGRLISAGDATGQVQIFDVSSRAILRTFKFASGDSSSIGNAQTSHNNNNKAGDKLSGRGIHTTRFLNDNIHVIAAGDDRTVRLMDIPQGQVVCEWKHIHNDYVRSSCVSSSNFNLFFTGSYDGTVKMFDIRTKKGAVLSLDHSSVQVGAAHHPVESILAFPGDAMLVSASSNSLYLWDILGGSRGRLMQEPISSHQKTVTDLCFNSDHSRILSSSLDQSVKVWNTANWNIVHSFKYATPVLSLALSKNEQHLYAGMPNGLLTIKERRVQVTVNGDVQLSLSAKDQESSIYHLGPKLTAPKNRNERDMKLLPGSIAYFMRGQYRPADEDDIVIGQDQKRRKRLRPYEKKLKAFEYKEALDTAIELSNSPATIVALLADLRLRGDGLKIALSGRDATALFPILHFIFKNLLNPRYFSILQETFQILLDKYGSYLDQSEECRVIMAKIKSKVREELETLDNLKKLSGALEMMCNFSLNLQSS